MENSAFKEIIERGFPNRNLLSRPTLMKQIESEFESSVTKHKLKLSKILHAATTAGCWSIFKK